MIYQIKITAVLPNGIYTAYYDRTAKKFFTGRAVTIDDLTIDEVMGLYRNLCGALRNVVVELIEYSPNERILASSQTVELVPTFMGEQISATKNTAWDDDE